MLKMMVILSLLLLGCIAGVCSGLVGIGGGIIIIPALVFFFGFTQQMAQGTTLALLVPPIGIFAAWTYYRQGYVDMKIAALICIGFVIGSIIGSRLALRIPTILLTKMFGGFLLLVGIKMLFSR